MTILTILILIKIGCSNSAFSDTIIEFKAMKITERLDSNSVNIFKKWNYSQRGQTGFWSKVSGDSNLYTCNYSVDKDTATLTIFKPDIFSKDFPCSYTFDTSKYYRFVLSKYDNVLRIKAVGNNGRDYILDNNLHFDSLFSSTNPFDKLSELTALKDSLGVFGISYRSNIGNFIQFYLSTQYILTYLPDNLILNDFSKNIWEQEFKKGKTIKKNWNLRRLNQPIDNG